MDLTFSNLRFSVLHRYHPARLRRLFNNSILLLVIVSMPTMNFAGAVQPAAAAASIAPVPQAEITSAQSTQSTIIRSIQPNQPASKPAAPFVAQGESGTLVGVTVQHSGPEGPHPWVNHENFVSNCPTGTFYPSIAGSCSASWTIYNDSGFTLADYAGYDIQLIGETANTPVYFSSTTEICRAGDFNRVVSCAVTELIRGEFFKAQEYLSIEPWERIPMHKTIFWTLDPDIWWLHERSMSSLCREKDGFTDNRECAMQNGARAQGAAADPILTYSGVLDYPVEDLSMQTTATSLSFLRSYSSALERSSSLGYGWTHNHDTYLIFPDDVYGETGVVWFKAHSANEYAFKINEDGTYSSLSGVLASLTKDSGPPITYTITTEWGESYLFDEDGKLLTWSDSEGRPFTNTYTPGGLLDRVTGPSGTRYISFDYDAQDRIEAVSDHTGRVVRFGYDGNGDLVTHTDVLGGVWGYEYDADHNLTDVNDPRGITQLQIEYDAEGRAVHQYNGEGELQADLTFNEGGSTTVLDGLGNSFTHTYGDRNTLIQVTNAAGHISTKDYDSQFRPTTVTDENGDITSLTWSDNGAGITRVVDPAGFQTDMIYDALNNLQELTDGRGNTTTFTYDGKLLTTSTDELGNITSYTYTTVADAPQPPGLLKMVADPLLRETHFTYNTLGDLVEMVDASGGTWGYAYNDLGWLVELTNPHNAITKYDYDNAGRVTSLTRNFNDSLPQNEENLYNIITSFIYDEVGNLVDTLDTYNRVTHFVYDDADRLLAIIENYKPGFSPSQDTNVETQFTYDLAGNPIAVLDPLGRITRTYYDALNRPVKVVQNLTAWDITNNNAPPFDPAQPDENVPTIYKYDPVGNLIQVEDALGVVSQACYDGRGLPTKSILNPTVPDPCPTYGASGNSDFDIIQRWTYDAVGNLLSQTDPNGAITTLSYEDRNLLERITNPLGFVTSFKYDAAGNQTSMTDADDVVTRYEYDALNRLDAVVENFIAAGPVDQETNVRTTYTYDPVGNLKRVTDASGSGWSYIYNGLNQLVGEDDPLGNTQEYDYDAVGQLTRRTDPKGFTTIHGYDALNRLLSIDYPAPDADVSLVYDALGNRESMLDGLGTTTWSYDGLNRPLTINDPFSEIVAYVYDAVGNRTGITYPDGKTVSYEYDSAYRLRQVEDWDSDLTTYAYDKAGRPLTASLPNGITSNFGWDSAGRLETLTHNANGFDLASYAYSYDKLANRTQAAEYVHQPLKPPAGPYTIYLPMLSGVGTGSRDTIIDYEYDPLYRLKEANYSSGENFQYEYDAVGNRISQQTHLISNNYQYDSAHRLIDVDGVAYTWDDNGNLIDDGTRTFTYDHADRLVAVSDQVSAFSFSYDGLGNRYQQTVDGSTTTYSLDLAARLTQVLGDGSSNYTYGLGRIGEEDSSAWQYPLGDALGSVRQLTDSAAKVTMAGSFEPFGAPMATAGTASSDFGFTGEQDAAGLVFLRARFYDPGIGRFISKDPFPGFPSLPATLHPYSYAMNNPVNLVDPSGQNPLVIAAALGGLIGGIGGAIFHALANPCQSLGDMLTSFDFWRDVGVGAISGALAGLVGAFMPQLLPALGLNIQASLLAAVFGGALTGAVVSGTAQVVTNLLTGQKWHTGLVGAVLTGAVIGGIAGGVGYKVRQWLSKAQSGSPQQTSKPGNQGSKNALTGGEVKPFEDMLTRTGYERHHLIEQRLAERLGIQPGKIPSVYLTPAEHQPFTNTWRALIGYKNSANPINTNTATWENVWDTSQRIYSDYPTYLNAVETILNSVR